MTAADVWIGARVRLSEDGRARRLWAAFSEAEATIRDTTLMAGQLYACVNVDGERHARIRTMQPEYLDLVTR